MHWRMKCDMMKDKPSELGINGVPFFVINDRYGVSGAQQPEVFLQTLEKAWQEYEKEHPELKLATAG